MPDPGMTSEWRDRLAHWIHILSQDFYTPLGKMNWEMFETMEELSYEDAMERNAYQDVPDGFIWGHSFSYAWFRTSFVLPLAAQGERIVLDLHPGWEASVFVNGKAFGTCRAAGIGIPHHYLVDNTIVCAAKGGEAFDIVLEVYAGHYVPTSYTGEAAAGPVLEDMYRDPLAEGERVHTGISTYGIWNEEAYQLYMDVQTLYKELKVLDPTSLRARHVIRALQDFTLTADFEQERSGRIASYRAAEKKIAWALSEKNGDAAPLFYAVGNAHVDLAWLWPMAETHRKSERTFAAQLRLLKEYPDYVYLQSQPALYEMCRLHYPALFEEIRKAVKDGRWIAEGAMWVEPDTNMPGGESLVRQLLYGKKYFKEMFGVNSRVLWLPDSFGYSAALPQLLKKAGVDYIVTQKIFWSYNEGETFPYHYFTWEGLDGSKVRAFLPTSYTYDTDPGTLGSVWKERRQPDLEGFLIPFGYGDGGGGPTRDHVEYALRQKDLQGSPRVRLSGPVEFFEEMEAKGAPLQTYTGELYFSAHRGTYTSQAAVKKCNRKSEVLLREAELWNALTSFMTGTPYPASDLEAAWKKLLLMQFHDILPGSGIARVYEDAAITFGEIKETGKELLAKGLSTFLKQKAKKMQAGEEPAEKEKEEGIVFFNSLGRKRTALVTLPASFAGGALSTDGTPVRVYTREDARGDTGDFRKTVQALLTLPPLGGVCLVPGTDAAGPLPAVHAWAEEEFFYLENELVKGKINDRGEVVSFLLKDDPGMDFAKGRMNRLRIFKDVPRRYDAWDIDSNYELMEMDGAGDCTVSIGCERGPEVFLNVRGVIGNSSYRQKISLRQGSNRMEVDMEIDWQELHKLLKVSFPVSIHATEALHEIQYGYIKRPTHRSRLYDKDRFEVCNHRYSALAESGRGAAVLNDCKYGISVAGSDMNLTLLRAPAAPGLGADKGKHHFRYAFLAFTGSFEESDVPWQGYECNVPVLSYGGYLPGSFSLFSVDSENIILDAVKLCEDGSGDILLRLYEAKGGSVFATIRTQLLQKTRACLCSLIEEEEKELQVLCDVNGPYVCVLFHAFEVQTLRIMQKKG